MEYELIIFDLDGTLVETYTEQILPGVAEYFRKICSGPGSCQQKIAIATNQGGVAMRSWLEKRGKDGANQYPTVEDVEKRLEAVTTRLVGEHRFPVYACFAFRTRQGTWLPTPDQIIGDPRWSPAWRKPNPGMLIQAMEDAGVYPTGTLMVGDRPDDQMAAAAAGCGFAWADDFFGSPLA